MVADIPVLLGLAAAASLAGALVADLRGRRDAAKPHFAEPGRVVFR